MNKKTSLMITALVLLLGLAACAPTAQVSSNAQGITPQMSVTGSGVVYVVPDIAYINVGVRSQGDTVADAMSANNEQAQAIKDTLVGQGVDEMDIQTSSFNVYPQSDYDYQGVITRTYFSVENNVYVTVRNLDKLGAILDAVAASGANTIYGINFDVVDKTEAQTSARQLAVDSAKTQAQELADAAGVTLGEIQFISSSYSYPNIYSGYGMGGGGAAYAMSDSVPIASGQITVSADVTITFGIK
ncbi:SIMPL domain-containing protein [Pelolinea submarina]|uniref:SIMPL domain-containing protein n=1 Tax=Pelolinea submarina TaxID=913107 RepID=A0A347ZNF7_9CHLR|nr:SIMPL domain-containing protein [Pelolinea submarina]REG08440.1 hypothetical protein DFR64_1807 [Pelolinea submarina]BBB46838.1 hypothetical protein Pelsub_P0065 [Pelolinea submarina]